MKSMNNVQEKRLLNFDYLKQSACALLGIEGVNESTKLNQLNLGLSNENFEFLHGRQRFLLKAYHAEIPQPALRVQQQLADSMNITTRPIAWSSEKRLALFDYWPGEVYNGQDWLRVLGLLVEVHQNTLVDSKEKDNWSIDVVELLKSIKLQERFYSEFDVARLISALSTYPRFSAYCHNDLVRDNILSNGSEIRLIDFEYAGWHDAYFDLAALTVTFKLDECQAELMLVEYHKRMTSPHRVCINKLYDYRLAYLSLCVEWYEIRGFEREANLLLSQLPTWTSV